MKKLLQYLVACFAMNVRPSSIVNNDDNNGDNCPKGQTYVPRNTIILVECWEYSCMSHDVEHYYRRAVL